MTPEERFERVIEMLEEDAARLRGAVPWSLVLRVCETNRFDALQIAEVRRRLIQREVDIEWDADSEEDAEQAPAGATEPFAELEEPEGIDRRSDIDIFAAYVQEVAQCELLNPETEKTLMRRIRAGERAMEALSSCEPCTDSRYLMEVVPHSVREMRLRTPRWMNVIENDTQWPARCSSRRPDVNNKRDDANAKVIATGRDVQASCPSPL